MGHATNHEIYLLELCLLISVELTVQKKYMEASEHALVLAAPTEVRWVRKPFRCG